MGARVVQLNAQLLRRRRTLFLAATTAGVVVAASAASVALTSGRRAPAPGPPDMRPAPGEIAVAHHPTLVDGARWEVKTYRNGEGKLCAVEVVPGEGEGGTCFDESRMFAKSPVVPYVGSRQDPALPAQWSAEWIWGFAAAEIDRIDLVFTDCSDKTLPLDGSRLFFDVEGPAVLHSRRWPLELVGYDRSGAALARIDVELGAPPTPEARAAGIAAPTPAVGCS